MSQRILILLALTIALPWPQSARAQETVKQADSYSTENEIAYLPENQLDDYARERCRLDLYYPKELKNFPTVVWFHGGGLTGGSKAVPEALKNKGVAVVAVNYRLSPRAKSPAYIEDAAAAVAWAFKNIEKYGGSPDKIFVSGHSAGGYLAAMVGLEQKWLAAHQIDANRIAGLAPFSGHMITHHTVRAEKGIADTKPVVDELAPLSHVRPDAPPMLLITGDRNLEMLGRYEENAYMWRMMKVAGHMKTELFELQGYNHGGMAAPAYPLLLNFIRKTLQTT